MSNPNTLALAGPRRPLRRLVGLIALAVLTLTTSGCFRLVEGKTYAIGMETNRANLVIHTTASAGLYQLGKQSGSATSRSVILANTPAKLPISRVQRAALCGVSVGLCLSADRIGSTLVSWFKNDIRNRGDFWEALSYAGRHDRCLAWTFAPTRNLTHKGRGTAGCAKGTM